MTKQATELKGALSELRIPYEPDVNAPGSKMGHV